MLILKKTILFCVALFLLLSCFLFISNTALAQFGLENFNSGSSNTFFSANQNMPTTVTRIISIIIGIIGVLLLVLLIYGGVLYATSAGNDEQVDKGKKVLTYSIIGIVIVSFSFVITNYVIVGLFSDEDDWQSYSQQSSGGGGNSGNSNNGGNNDNSDDENVNKDEQSKAEATIEEGNNLLVDGMHLRERGNTMVEEGESLIAEGDAEAGQILIDDGQDLIDRGNERIEEGHRTLDEGYALNGESSGYSRDAENRRRSTDAAEVDLNCKWIKQTCYLNGRIGEDCCPGLECREGIFDSGYLWGSCEYEE